MKKTLLAILLAAAGVAHAEFLDGNKLLSMIRTEAQAPIALGYVTGVADAHTGVTTCPPDLATPGQMRDMVRKFLEANPEHRSHSADTIVCVVLQAAWPCKNKTTAPAGAKLI